MRTTYVYLSWAGWIWFVIAGSYLLWKMRSLYSRDPKGSVPQRGFDVIVKEEKQSDEQ